MPEFKTGELIFGKMRGYPPWPARIQGKIHMNKYSVFFFGTHQTGVLKVKEIYPYEKFKEKYGKTQKSRVFNKSLWEIENTPTIAEFVPISAERNRNNNCEREEIKKTKTKTVEKQKEKLSVDSSEESESEPLSEYLKKLKEEKSISEKVIEKDATYAMKLCSVSLVRLSEEECNKAMGKESTKQEEKKVSKEELGKKVSENKSNYLKRSLKEEGKQNAKTKTKKDKSSRHNGEKRVRSKSRVIYSSSDEEVQEETIVYNLPKEQKSEKENKKKFQETSDDIPKEQKSEMENMKKFQETFEKTAEEEVYDELDEKLSEIDKLIDDSINCLNADVNTCLKAMTELENLSPNPKVLREHKIVSTLKKCIEFSKNELIERTAEALCKKFDLDIIKSEEAEESSSGSVPEEQSRKCSPLL